MNSILALVLATTILVAIPGPNVALIVANSLQHGLRAGAITVSGTTAGVALQLLLVIVGISTLVEYVADALTWVRWLGVIYLIVLAIQTIREPAKDLGAVTAAPAVFWRACGLAAVNPKTLLFNAAFIPQFAGSGSLGQFSLAATVFLAVLLLGDLLWAVFANAARHRLARFSRWQNRLSGGFLALAGLGLAAANRN